MLSSVKLTILAENRANNPRLIAEQGLAILVETGHESILFDTGQTSAFITNARQLQVDLGHIDKIVLSHGHFDHTGGLPGLLTDHKKLEIICHPALTNKKYRIYPAGRLDIGVPWEKSKLQMQGAVFNYKSHAAEIAADVWISGEIPRNTAYEKIEEEYQQRVLESYIHDEIHDDMCLILNTVKGLIILLGCGHSGAVNSIKHAMRVTDQKKIYAVMGGMHLQHHSEEQLRPIIAGLQKLDPAHLIPLHCTGFMAINRMYQVFKERLHLLNVGEAFQLSA